MKNIFAVEKKQEEKYNLNKEAFLNILQICWELNIFHWQLILPKYHLSIFFCLVIANDQATVTFFMLFTHTC